jgi:hypothetical protein
MRVGTLDDADCSVFDAASGTGGAAPDWWTHADASQRACHRLTTLITSRKWHLFGDSHAYLCRERDGDVVYLYSQLDE